MILLARDYLIQHQFLIQVKEITLACALAAAVTDCLFGHLTKNVFIFRHLILRIWHKLYKHLKMISNTVRAFFVEMREHIIYSYWNQNKLRIIVNCLLSFNTTSFSNLY